MKKRLAKMMMIFALAASMMSACGKKVDTNPTEAPTEVVTTPAVTEATLPVSTEAPTEAPTKPIITKAAPKVSQNTKEYYENLFNVFGVNYREYREDAGKVDLQKDLQFILRSIPQYTVFNEQTKGKATPSDSETVKAVCEQFIDEYLATGTSTVSTNKNNRPIYQYYELIHGQMTSVTWLDEHCIEYTYYALMNDKNKDGVVGMMFWGTADNTSGKWVVENGYSDYAKNLTDIPGFAEVVVFEYLDPTTMQYKWGYTDEHCPALIPCYFNATPSKTELWDLETARNKMGIGEDNCAINEYHH